MQMTTLLNRIHGRLDELALIQSEPIFGAMRALGFGSRYSHSCLPIPDQGLKFVSESPIACQGLWARLRPEDFRTRIERLIAALQDAYIKAVHGRAANNSMVERDFEQGFRKARRAVWFFLLSNPLASGAHIFC